MEITANKGGGVSGFRRAIKRTIKGVHVGIVGDFETPRAAKNQIYLWSCIKRHANHRLLFKIIFRLEFFES